MSGVGSLDDLKAVPLIKPLSLKVLAVDQERDRPVIVTLPGLSKHILKNLRRKGIAVLGWPWKSA